MNLISSCRSLPDGSLLQDETTNHKATLKSYKQVHSIFGIAPAIPKVRYYNFFLALLLRRFYKRLVAIGISSDLSAELDSESCALQHHNTLKTHR